MPTTTTLPPPNRDAFDRVTQPIVRMLTVDQARQLVHYRADEELQSRIDELAEKNTEGLLTAAERADYEAYVQANRFIATLQAQAQKFMAGISQ